MNRPHIAGLVLLISLINSIHSADTISPPVHRIVDSTLLHAPVSIGELVDKITILEIKTRRVSNQKKRANVFNELQELTATLETHISLNAELTQLKAKLLKINEQLWEIEDDIRGKEAQQLFDEEFVQLSRNVYFTNDKRCAVKRKINELTESAIIEEKEYTRYPSIE